MFEADGRLLISLRFFHDLKYVVDLNEEVAPQILLDASPARIKIPEDQNIVILPADSARLLTVITEKQHLRKIPIKVNLDLMLVAGFVTVGDYRPSPDSITAVVTTSYLDSLSSFETEEHRVSDVDRSLELEMQLRPVNTKKVDYKADKVKVRVEVQKLGTVSFQNLPIRIINLPPNINVIVQPSTFSVSVKGGVEHLATLTRDSLRGYIDYALEDRLNRAEPRLQIVSPKFTTWSKLTPRHFRLISINE